jgi:serine/threonine-protein kinase/endoribonuclease IRE1
MAIMSLIIVLILIVLIIVTYLNCLGTPGWIAPELLMNNKNELLINEIMNGDKALNKGTRMVDIFSLGCIIFYVITNGIHPFGSNYEREMRIINNNPNLDIIELSNNCAFDIVGDCLQYNPSERIQINELLGHPMFWYEMSYLLYEII